MNWEQDLREAFEETGDKYKDMVTTLTNVELYQEFDGGFGIEKGVSFTAWGENFVYFPLCYDGAEWVGYAPRNPCDIKSGHQGG